MMVVMALMAMVVMTVRIDDDSDDVIDGDGAGDRED